ncbi:MAG: citrate synthase family protein [Capsulimonas sp.]|uniref:citrate synthase family protein n=1 Tax=Capsulimonas sp. TaxID=2494211 RepID=UPI003266CE82
MSSKDFFSASEAAAELGVSLATLYSYVSRGMLRSEGEDNAKRSRRYPAEDVRRLRQRRELRHNPEQGVGEALSWGLPLLESKLTLVEGGRCYYRGREIGGLARTHSLESVAALFWTGDFAEEALVFGSPPALLSPSLRTLRRALSEAPPTELFLTLLPAACAEDGGAWDFRPAQVARTGARILRLMTTLAAGRDALDGDERISGALARAWGLERDAERVLDAALVLCVDHELSVSSFTARCVASAGATAYHAVLGGLAAFQGTKHGGATSRVEALLRECAAPEQAGSALRARLRRGEAVPGFGHPLYPEGDPRGRLLLEMAREIGQKSREWALAEAVAREGSALLGEHPTIDFGLVALRGALGLPPGAALTLFELGRSVGWIGHAIEEYRADRLIRPRARYSGPRPGTLEE